MTRTDDLRLYLLDMAEQLAELARGAGLSQGAAYLALAAMALQGADVQVADDATTQQAHG